MRSKFISGQRILDNVPEHTDVVGGNHYGSSNFAPGVESLPRLGDDVVHHPVVGHGHGLAFQVVIVRHAQVENKGSFIVVESILLQQQVHFLYFKNVIIHVIGVNCSIKIVQEIIVFNFPNYSGHWSHLESDSLIVSKVIVTNL